MYRSHVYICGRLFFSKKWTNERLEWGELDDELIWISFILVSCLFYFYLVLSSHCHWISFDIIFRAPRLPCIRQNDTKTFHTQETFFFSFRWLHFFSPSFIVYMFRLWPRSLVSGGRRMFDWRMERRKIHTRESRTYDKNESWKHTKRENDSLENTEKSKL